MLEIVTELEGTSLGLEDVFFTWTGKIPDPLSF